MHSSSANQYSYLHLLTFTFIFIFFSDQWINKDLGQVRSISERIDGDPEEDQYIHGWGPLTIDFFILPREKVRCMNVISKTRLNVL